MDINFKIVAFIDNQNHMGETALHWAARAGISGKKATCILLILGARVSIYNDFFRRPLDVSAAKFIDVDEEMQRYFLQKGGSSVDAPLFTNACKIGIFLSSSTKEKQETRGNFFQYSPQSRTLVLHHPECLDHVPKAESDWECPERVQTIIKMIESATGNEAEVSAKVREYEIQISSDFERASLEVLSRVHSAEYLTFVHDLSKELEQRQGSKGIQAVAVPFTPVVSLLLGHANFTFILRGRAKMILLLFPLQVQRALMKYIPTKAASQSDTSFGSGSLRAARRAAGAVQHAVDWYVLSCAFVIMHNS